MDANARYCEAQVRDFDRDRYLATLFAPDAHRDALFALYAFDIELARVRELAREPMPGEIRLQWWREVVDGNRDGEARAHPVAARLIAALDAELLAPDRLQGMIEARSFDLYDEPFVSIVEWEGYADATLGALIACAMAVLTGPGVARSEVTFRAGRALSGIAILRQLPVHLSRGQCFVPLEMLNHFGARIENGFQGRVTPEWCAALAEMRLRVRRSLDAAAPLIDDCPETALPALLPCAVIRPTLAQMERDSYDPLRPPELPQWWRQWLLWRAARNPTRIFG